LEALRVAGSEQSVEQDVIRFECGISFQFAAPISILMLSREKKSTDGSNCGRHTIDQPVDFAKEELRGGR
jgi:hypothetical protein